MSRGFVGETPRNRRYVRYEETSAEAAAAITIKDTTRAPGDIERYGAKLDGTDDSTAFQAAVDQNNQGGPPVRWRGDTTLATSIRLYNRSAIFGDGRFRSTLTFTGSSAAFVSNTTGSRTYDWLMRDFYLNNTGSGTIGLDLQRVSTGNFENLTVNNFDTAVNIDGANLGHAVYNRFYNVTAQNCSADGFSVLDGANATVLLACRANICGRGVYISRVNETHMAHGQLEQCTTGIEIDVGAGQAGRNIIAFNRFENNTTDWIVNSAVTDTAFVQNYYVDNDLTYTDNGTRTQLMETQGNASIWKLNSVVGGATAGAWYFERSANGGSGENPAFHINDSNTSTGTPITLRVETNRSGGHCIQAHDGTNELFGITGAGLIRTNQSSANTNTPSGATAYQLPIYDETGTLLGYIPIYSAAW